MAKRITVLCTKCQSPVELEERSLRRYKRKRETEEYICITCINRLNASRPIDSRERAERAKRARALWNNAEYRQRVKDGVQKVAGSDAFRNNVSQNNRKRWKDEDYRRRMESLQNSPEYRSKLSKSALTKWEDEEYRKRVLESRLNKEDLP